MEIKTYPDRFTMSRAAADHASTAIHRAITLRGQARVVAATGTSQIEFLEALTAHPTIDWPRVELFHLDEYLGLPIEHPASFRRFLLDRLITKVGIRRYHLLNGESDPWLSAEQVGMEVSREPIDLAFVGIGENGHLAFNDPPADFTTERPYLIVALDDACRRQQVGEGWFAGIESVPSQAITMSVRQILKSRTIISVVPEARKAEAVRASIDGSISPMVPASILRMHDDVTLYLDRDSARLLSPVVGIFGDP